MKTLYVNETPIAVFELDGKGEKLTLVHPNAAIFDLTEIRQRKPTADELLAETDTLNDAKTKHR